MAAPVSGTSPSDAHQIGPLPPSISAESTEPTRKRKRQLENEEVFLAKLPNSPSYEKSYMHRQEICFVLCTVTDIVITASFDGHIKFWKKLDKGIDFVMHFRAHSDEVVGMSANKQGILMASVSRNREMRVFDICNYDMINMFELKFTPLSICSAFLPGHPHHLFAVSDANSGKVHLIDAKGNGEPLYTFDVHKHPVSVLNYNENFNTIVSIDTSGMMEYWVPQQPFELPRNFLPWEFKSDTDLYTYKKARCAPSSLEFSQDGTMFVTYGLKDRQVRVWKFATAKLFRVYDESLTTISEMQQTGTGVVDIDDMEFGRRLALDRELETSYPDYSSKVNAVFDESGHFVVYSTLIGVKFVNITTNKAAFAVGHAEATRILNIALYQGVPQKRAFVSVEMMTAENEAIRASELGDPSLFCTALKKNRFYIFTRREPDKEDVLGRDVFNEKPSKEEQTAAAAIQTSSKGAGIALASQAILHTTLGDVVVKLFPEHAPKAVENFTTHARNSYYNKHLFHRVIKGFMIQTGDPRGDGTGGESIWGEDFKDEFVSSLRHDQPGTLSMANAGPNTNGSQFFITTAKTPWLDSKHTIFGRVVSGLDVVHAIEATKADANDKPLNDIRIVSITVQKVS